MAAVWGQRRWHVWSGTITITLPMPRLCAWLSVYNWQRGVRVPHLKVLGGNAAAPRCWQCAWMDGMSGGP